MYGSNQAKIYKTEQQHQLKSFGARLRFVRESLNISRYDVERSIGIDEAVLRKVEKSESESVNAEIISKMYQHFDGFKKFVDPVWLVYGTTDAPTFTKELESVQERVLNYENKLIFDPKFEEENINTELIIWGQLYEQSVYLKIFDDYLMPNIKKNDYLGAFYINKKELYNIEPCDVLISTKDNSGLVPYHFLKMNHDDVIFCHLAKNEDTIKTTPLHIDKIDKVARIILHRRNTKRTSK